MGIEKNVVAHYARDNMGEEILTAARQTADDPEQLTTKDMALYDEFHIGGRPATKHFTALLEVGKGTKVLDVGSGIGGPARFIAGEYDALVTGIDLSPDFVEAADIITKALEFKADVKFHCGSALDLPFEDESFDCAYMMHVGMNIKDKAALYKEISRVLKPDSVFGIYDIMADKNVSDMIYPAPWAGTKETSFLEAPADIENHLKAAGLEIKSSESRQDFALAALEKMIASPQASMRATTPDKLNNLLSNVRARRCAPHIFICEK